MSEHSGAIVAGLTAVALVGVIYFGLYKATMTDPTLTHTDTSNTDSVDGGTPVDVSTDMRIRDALAVANSHGGIEGDHHRAWVIDQIVRALTRDKYEAWVAEHCRGELDGEIYDWDVGVPP